jgi:hypothetical protein
VRVGEVVRGGTKLRKDPLLIVNPSALINDNRRTINLRKGILTITRMNERMKKKENVRRCDDAVVCVVTTNYSLE